MGSSGGIPSSGDQGDRSCAGFQTAAHGRSGLARDRGRPSRKLGPPMTRYRRERRIPPCLYCTKPNADGEVDAGLRKQPKVEQGVWSGLSLPKTVASEMLRRRVFQRHRPDADLVKLCSCVWSLKQSRLVLLKALPPDCACGAVVRTLPFTMTVAFHNH
jgi:hypothetical protein